MGRPGNAVLGRACVVALAACTLLLVPGLGAPRSPHPATGGVLNIVQSRQTTDQQAFNVGIQLSNAANVTFAFYTLCQVTSPVCYAPVAMTANATGWFSGWSKTMPNYPGMTQGVVAGYNITVNFADGSNLTEPALPNSFAGLSVVTTVSGQYEYGMVVQNPVFGLSGVVKDSVTGVGIAGASVKIVPGNNTTLTDSGGNYHFTGLLNGTYELWVNGTGYHAGSSSVTVSGTAAVQNIPLANSTQPPPNGGGGGGSSSSALPLLDLAAIAIVVLVAAVVAAVVILRGKGKSPPA
jgi:hypothetical protein